jgi:hypothetical protein
MPTHFLHDLKTRSESPKTSKYVVMLPSHTDTPNTAIQYYILKMSASVALLPCHHMLCQQRQVITPQLEFSPITIHMGFQMDTVTLGQIFSEHFELYPVSYRSISIPHSSIYHSLMDNVPITGHISTESHPTTPN